MVNFTYGSLSEDANGNIIFNALGTDMVITVDDTTSAFDPGDTAFILMCAALIIFMASLFGRRRGGRH